ncbi:uncharacterized protein E5676_scaffold113G00440 [Cucumis melo var. makuwa]|uniref:Gag protease polyprotein n=1 Tax=Cucumis melo var. makuwa TaxID=1194695 RepID=A0A5A7UDG8_CUCMM|nr:uncharacterized protein E6C27_scaffold207G00620 [Cucumis melo var. makuwa]TYK01810.1 uncharacterized protein E5676_scaffold113G00440 [Cucumis melo var. makuwa]
MSSVSSNLAFRQPSLIKQVAFERSFGFTEDQRCSYEITDCTCLGTCQLGAEVGVRVEESWRMTRSMFYDQNDAMFITLPELNKIKGTGRTQLEEQPVVQTANPTAPVTQADLAAMEQRYQDMLRDALASLHVVQQTQLALLRL